MSPLAVLRDPTPEEASRWRKPRTEPVATRMKVVSQCFEQEPGIRIHKRTASGVDLLLDVEDGTTLRLAFRDEQVTVSLGLELVGRVRKEQTPTDELVAYGDLCNLVEVIQLGTGFYVFSDVLLGFDPSGECPSCHVEVFEWQSECELCAAQLHAVVSGQDAEDARAKRVVDAMLRRKMIELVSSRGRRSVEVAVGAFYAHGTASHEVLLSILMDMPGVAEVYCDETSLLHLLLRVR